MSKTNIQQRLSGTKRPNVGPNDLRRRIQHKNNAIVKRFDARDHLNKRNKLSDAREQLNKIKGSRPSVKEQTTPKVPKPLMNIPLKRCGSTSLKDGSLTRTVKGNSKVQTSLKEGTLIRTVKGMNKKLQAKQAPKNIPRLSHVKTAMKKMADDKRATIQNQTSRKRIPTINDIWNRSPAGRQSLPAQFIEPVYDNYNSVVSTGMRPMIQPRPSIIPVHMPRHYDYEDPVAIVPDAFSRNRLTQRSYRPEYTLLRPDESRQFREFLQQQEINRNDKIRESMMELEARRRASLLQFEESERRFYKEQMSSRKTSAFNNSYGHDVIVSNLIPVIHESEIESCFHQFGKVLSIDFINKTTAKIKYDCENDAKVAALFLDNKEVPVIFGTSYIGTKYSKQRISVKLPSKSPTANSTPTYFSDSKATNRIFGFSGKSESFRDTSARSRSTLTRGAALKFARQVEGNLDATHSALFNNRNVQIGSPSKSFLVRRM